ncbi:MAG TPA: tryptophan 7-halogenase [Vicinamibacterales bacterium]|nr:tryptophan 7-halogenase [Vicinamibacterales bacterium]
MTGDFDLAVVGSGFGGSLLAMIAQRLGYRTALLERGRHPRFAIGESASPLAGILIEQLADRYGLPRIRPLSAYGSWQRTYPQVVCGLKRGFTYFRHERGMSYRADADRGNQLLVAASPSDELSDTHWLRSDVDHFLVREAISLGVEYLDEMQIESWDRREGCSVVGGRRRGTQVSLRVPFLVDASGPNGFVSRTLGLENRGFAGYPNTQALFSHFTGVARCGEMPDFAGEPDPPSLRYGEARPTISNELPYPMDDAALHHVFDGGWMWVLRFGNGVTSAGIAVTDELAAELKLADGEPAWHRFLSLYPSIAAQFAIAQPTREFTWIPRLSWRVDRAVGDGWAMLPSAAAFIDPLFSTGIPLTLVGIERLARILEKGRGALNSYADVTLAEADHTARFIAGCYAAFPRFDQFTAYSMFYFAAASFSEMARRLCVKSDAARFLGADRAAFVEALVRLSPQSHGPDPWYASAVARSIEPLNIAGLGDPAKRNWYPVDLRDIVRGARKLGVSTVSFQTSSVAGEYR